jgi:cytosine/adenosine deaminase-related metal-dependent hydrolase
MVPSFDVLLQGCRLPDGRLVDLGTLDGKIAEIGPLTGHPATAPDCGGGSSPGLVDAHPSDKALLRAGALDRRHGGRGAR